MSLRFLLAGAVSAVLCGPALSETIIVGKPNWPSAQVTAHIIAEIVEDKLGVEAKLRPIGSIELIGAIDRDEIDVHPEIWLPNTQEIIDDYVNVRRTLTLSPISVTASQHMCTTRQTMESTGLTAVEDLTNPEIAAYFDTDDDGKGEVWIGANTWSSTRIERVRARSYGYDETMMLLTMPEEQAMAAVDAAVAIGSPLVFYCYAPHYLFALHDDVVLLEEPDYDPAAWKIVAAEQDPAWLSLSRAPTAWEPSRYHVGYASALAENSPAVARFLDKFQMNNTDAEAMSYAVHVERRDPAEIAKTWISENSDRIEEWIQ